MKNALVLFSGGLDSTYLIWESLKRGYHITPIYIFHNNHSNKSDVETIQGKKIIDNFKKEFPNQIEDFSIYGNIYLRISENYPLLPRQIAIWLLYAVYTQDTNFHTEVQIGHIKNDPLIHPIINEIKNIYYSYQALCPSKLIPLEFPIIHKTKIEIINELPIVYFNDTISCDMPNRQNKKIKECGKCIKCRNNKNLNMPKMNEKFKNKNS